MFHCYFSAFSITEHGLYESNVSNEHKLAPKLPVFTKLKTDLFENFYILGPTETLNLKA